MRAVYAVSVIASIGMVAFFVFQGAYQSSYGALTDLFIDLAAGAALVSAAVTMMRYERDLGTRSGKVWLSFTAGILLWFLGEVTWSLYYDVLYIGVPFPSLADGFYLTGYLPLFAGFYLYVTYFRSAISRRAVMAVSVATIASAAVVFILLVGPVFATDEVLLAKFFDFAYPLLDLSLLSTSMLGLTLLVRGKLGSAWLLFNLGVLLNVFGDMLFSFTTAQGTYYSGALPDLFFLEGYLAFALAFYLHRKEV